MRYGTGRFAASSAYYLMILAACLLACFAYLPLSHTQRAARLLRVHIERAWFAPSVLPHWNLELLHRALVRAVSLRQEFERIRPGSAAAAPAVVAVADAAAAAAAAAADSPVALIPEVATPALAAHTNLVPTAPPRSDAELIEDATVPASSPPRRPSADCVTDRNSALFGATVPDIERTRTELASLGEEDLGDRALSLLLR